MINATLETLLRYLHGIPLGHIFETLPGSTSFIDTIRSGFFEASEFRDIMLGCLTEVGGLRSERRYIKGVTYHVHADQ